ncbi:hypothetical protein QA644_32075 (plasmid) [Rhizobium sp. CC1099]|uniref:hypothetical protein n=1 Tax=Rhizobium sp. CC1099 TaxID=3039160 RepID=UPI0024B086C3|nr:hypothetical protein [Rhizobium sp. CC1099]WFU90603.1 hypothetical protein QA644_32075 [Rhizobium sp. CC1099]
METPKSSYLKTVLWAQALHTAFPEIKGSIWTSSQCDSAGCLILFGDRVRESDFDVLDCIDIATNPNLLLELRGYGKRAGITII